MTLEFIQIKSKLIVCGSSYKIRASPPRGWTHRVKLEKDLYCASLQILSSGNFKHDIHHAKRQPLGSNHTAAHRHTVANYGHKSNVRHLSLATWHLPRLTWQATEHKHLGAFVRAFAERHWNHRKKHWSWSGPKDAFLQHKTVIFCEREMKGFETQFSDFRRHLTPSDAIWRHLTPSDAIW